MHLEAGFDHDDDDAPDDDGCDDDVGGGAKTRDLMVDLILCILCSSETKKFKTGLFHLRPGGETEQHPLFKFMLCWSITLLSKQKLKHFYRKLTHYSMYLNCPSVWKGGNEFVRVYIYPPDFQEQSLGYLFLYLYLYLCQYLHPYL